jgi:hypothetical protein
MSKPKEAADQLAELQALFPEPEIVTQGDVSIAVPVFDYGQIARVLKIIIPVLKDADGTPSLELLIAEHGEEAAQVLAIALRKDVEFVNHLPPDFAVRLMQAVWRVNSDFFAARVRPLLPGMGAMTMPEASPAP